MRVVAFKTNHDDITARRPFQKNPSPFQGEGRERVFAFSTIRASLHSSPTEKNSESAVTRPARPIRQDTRNAQRFAPPLISVSPCCRVSWEYESVPGNHWNANWRYHWRLALYADRHQQSRDEARWSGAASHCAFLRWIWLADGSIGRFWSREYAANKFNHPKVRLIGNTQDGISILAET